MPAEANGGMARRACRSHAGRDADHSRHSKFGHFESASEELNGEPLQSFAAAEYRTDQFQLVSDHWAAARRLYRGDDGRSCLDRLNLPDHYNDMCGVVGYARTRPLGRDRFAFSSGGMPAVVVPCYDAVLPGAFGAHAQAHYEHLLDLLSFRYDTPKAWRLRRGHAVVLGAAVLDMVAQEGDPLTVFSEPLSWLRDGGEGITVLDWDWARDELRWCREFIVTDIATGSHIEAVLTPEILVRRAS